HRSVAAIIEERAPRWRAWPAATTHGAWHQILPTWPAWWDFSPHQRSTAQQSRVRPLAITRPKLASPRSAQETRIMAVLETRIDRSSPAYQENRAYFEGLTGELRQRIAQVREGGGAEAIKKHRAREKLLARERIEQLCDPDTPFLEFNPLAAWGM